MSILKIGSVPKHKHIVDVLKKEFGYPVDGYQRSYKLPENTDYIIWFPKLSKDASGRSDVPWIDLLSEDGCKIVVSWGGEESEKADVERNICKYAGRKQVVFANRLGEVGYEFLGVFECQRGNDGTWYQSDGNRHYKRISDSIDTCIVRSEHSCSHCFSELVSIIEWLDSRKIKARAVNIESQSVSVKLEYRRAVDWPPYVTMIVLGLLLFFAVFQIPGCLWKKDESANTAATIKSQRPDVISTLSLKMQKTLYKE